MTSRRWCRTILGATFCAAITLPVFADDKPPDEDKPRKSGVQTESKSDGPEVGKPAPAFTLKTCDGKSHSLKDYKDKIVVLEWFNKDCPMTKRYGDVMKTLAKKHKGVVWLAVDSTHFRTDKQNCEFATEFKIDYPILSDFDGKVGRAYKASSTPHMFVINRGVLAYNGALLNPRGEQKYVEEAMDALVAGKEVKVSKTRPFG